MAERTLERTLSERELRLALLARQLLVERADLKLPVAVERAGELQTQYAPSGYIGLWTRVAGFQRRDLTEALERRRIVQATMMRTTIHMASKRDYWPLTEGVRTARREGWARAVRGRVDVRQMRRAADGVRRLLSDGPRRRSEIVKALGLDNPTWIGAGLWVDMVRVPPWGTWDQRRADLYGLAEDWLGPSKATFNEGLDLLVQRYLGAFGPAARRDIANWAGLSVNALTPAIERLKLRRFRDELGAELLDLPRAPLPDPETPVPVRFLPTWDATLLVHARRTQILPERSRERVFHVKTPHSVSTFLVDGQVAGAWKHERGRIRIEPFDRVHRAARRELDDEAERLASFMA